MTRATSTTKQNSIAFGARAVSKQNYSNIICLPSIALQSLGYPESLEIHLIQDGNQSYIKLVPAQDKGMKK